VRPAFRTASSLNAAHSFWASRAKACLAGGDPHHLGLVNQGGEVGQGLGRYERGRGARQERGMGGRSERERVHATIVAGAGSRSIPRRSYAGTPRNQCPVASRTKSRGCAPSTGKTAN